METLIFILFIMIFLIFFFVLSAVLLIAFKFFVSSFRKLLKKSDSYE